MRGPGAGERHRKAYNFHLAIYGMAPTGWCLLIGPPVSVGMGLSGPRFPISAGQGRLQRVDFSLAGVVGASLFGFTYAWFVQPRDLYISGSAFLRAAGLQAIAALIAPAVMARAPKTAGAASS